MDPKDLIKAIRESFGASISVYTMGNCYQFYEILKVAFPEAEPYWDGSHVWTKIGDRFYDIKGEADLSERKLEYMDWELTGNKWTDERRSALKNQHNEFTK